MPYLIIANDSILNQLDIEHLSDSQKIRLYTTESFNLLDQSPDIAFKYALKAHNLAYNIPDPYLRLTAIYTLALNYLEKGNLDSTFYYLNLFLLNPDACTDSLLYAKCLHLKGKLHYNTAEYALSIQNYSEALVIFESNNKYVLVCDVLNCIGNIIAQQGKYEDAKKQYQKALKIAIENNDLKVQAFSYNNIAIMERQLGNIDHALNYLHKALDIKEKLHFYKSVGLTMSNIGDLYADKLNFTQALKYHNQALEIKKELNDKAGIAFSHNRIGLILNKTGKYYQALNHLQLAEEINSTSNYKKREAENYEIYADVYNNLGFYKKAYEYQKKFCDLTNTIFTESSKNQINDIQAKYEIAKKQEEIVRLTKENNLNDIVINKQRIIRLILILMLIIDIILIFFIYRQFKIKREANKILEQKNMALSQKSEEIKSQSEHLTKLNTELKQLSVVASKTDNAIMILDSKTNVKWINIGFTRMYGYTLEELQLKSNKNYIGSLSNINLRDIVNIWFGEKKTISFECLNTTKDGRKIWSQSTITPILDEENRVQHLISIESDITDLKKAAEEIQLKNKDILSSIHYAKKIQKAFMPQSQSLNNLFKENFIFLRPKDVVSGDFYWFSETKNKKILAVSDCTGHGVPGAFMSIIGINFLNQIIIEKEITNPAQILKELSSSIVNSLATDDIEENPKDGMDITLITIDKDSLELEFAGAMNSIYIARNNELIELNGDKTPVGFHELKENSFTLQAAQLQKDDNIYMFTDGFPDQFGGSEDKKFKYHNFKKLFLQISNESMDKQKELISNTFINWKGSYDQVDDILIVGVEI